MIRPDRKSTLHARNRFRAGYDFQRLAVSSPQLAPFVRPNAYGDLSIDYASPDAVKALNRALLHDAYRIAAWDVPPGYLCPPVPGRSDYVHHLADLISAGHAPEILRGPTVRILDIGTGANGIYPLIGASEYGWRFVGTDIDPAAVSAVRAVVAASPTVAGLIECRVQPSPLACFAGVVVPGESFTASMCNPPFHASADEAAEGTRRKRRNLGQSPRSRLNFGGQAGELWCDGGELAFVGRMIEESADIAHRCRWFTTLVSKSAHLPRFHEALRAVGARDVRTLGMAHGQKQSRILAWTFQPPSLKKL